MAEDWKKHFRQNALDYGKDEFLKGRVADLTEKDGKYTAAVLGTHRYEVTLFMKDGSFTRGKCTCPMARGGGNCGHMAAVLYALHPEEARTPESVEKAHPKERRLRKTEERRKAEELRREEEMREKEKLRREEEMRKMAEQQKETEQRREARRKRKEEKKRKEEERKRQAAAAREREAAKQKNEEKRRMTDRERKELEKKRREEKKRLEEEARRRADEKARQEKQQEEISAVREFLQTRGEIPKDGEKEYELLGEAWEDPDDAGESGIEQLASLSQYNYFDSSRIYESMGFSPVTELAGRKLLEEGKVELVRLVPCYDRMTGEVCGQALGRGTSGTREFDIVLVFSRNEVLHSDCRCAECLKDHMRWYSQKTTCAYTAALALELKEFLLDHPLTDATDQKAEVVLGAVEKSRANSIASDGKTQETLRLEPRLVKRYDKLELSFRTGNEKLYVIKDLSLFCRQVKNAETATYGKNTVIRHRLQDLTEQGKKWFHFLDSMIQEENQLEEKLLNRSYYSAAKVAKVGSSVNLFGWRLDRFYELLRETGGVSCEDKDDNFKGTISAGEKNPEIQVRISEKKITGDREFHGITVSGELPSLYYGTDTAYYISGGKMLRTDAEFRKKTEPLAAISDGDQFSFTIGRSRMAEFYYTVLPDLEDILDVTEETPELIRRYLPPDVRFTFYLDAEEGDITCKISAKYGGQEFSTVGLLDQDRMIESFRDESREAEMLAKVMQWLPYPDIERDCLCCGGEEETIYRMTAQGTDALLALGEVRCTAAFRNRQAVRRVKVSVGVSVSSGLLNLDITTTDVPPEELMDLLESYRQKKKYYRLKDGAFADLEEDSVRMLSELAEALRLKEKDFIKGKMHLPLYRTLYLDRMLEEHEEVYASRDSHFREMVKGFKTISDADFEEPASLSGIMRNYQKTGYKWLRTLEAWNFGGILADDMGLGKTLQIISLLLAAKEEGKKGTSLIITPASLVFNWGEEFARFAPELKVTLVTGGQDARKELLEEWKDSDVLVTSYDLLRRDIALYEEKEFRYQVIDEAQYIKNHATAASKAVKVIKSRTRYALTGTPIENRLSELWSIFDYLMPGFLYGYDVFRREIESPVVKHQDEEAMERLKKMVSPFILRRVKEDVLKDLPEKLEETRYVRFESGQQKLYDAQVLKLRESIESGGQEEFNKNRFRILAEITKLRQICCDPALCFENYDKGAAKAEACIDLVRSAIEGGHRILLFSQFTSMLDILKRELDSAEISCYVITGSTPKQERLELVKKFNKGDTPLFLISLKAGGVGLNLTGADVVIHYDPWWNVAAQNQATDRAHRIGQTKKVTVYKLIAKNTIEEKIQKLQETKKNLADQVIGGETGQLGGMSREDLLELLELPYMD